MADGKRVSWSTRCIQVKELVQRLESIAGGDGNERPMSNDVAGVTWEKLPVALSPKRRRQSSPRHSQLWR